MKYIESIREGERVSGIYLCKQRQPAVTKNGKPYENMILQDKTGVVDAKVWDPNSQGIEDFDALDYVEIMAEATSFQGALQLNVKRARKAREGEYDPADYLPVSEYDIEDMYRELMGFAAQVQEPHLRALLKSLFVDDKDFVRNFKLHSAAKTVHHSFVGGLLEHTLSVCRLCEASRSHCHGKRDSRRARSSDSGLSKETGKRAEALHPGTSRRAGVWFAEKAGSCGGSGFESG